MAAPRATQWIALRNLARGCHQVRQLHMTGPASYSSPLLTRERPVLHLPRDIAGLRAECKRRKIDAAGSKTDLLARLNADELVHSRAFSTASEKRPVVQQTQGVSTPAVRQFNVSRQLKAVKDSSTIDFAFLPDVMFPEPVELPIRVPILPTLDISSSQARTVAIEPEPVVMKPQISTMSADAVYQPLSEITDGHAMGIDFHAIADRAAANLRRMTVPVEEQGNIIKRVMGDMVDDILGIKKPART